MSKVYKFTPEKEGKVYFLEQDSELRAVEDFIALLEFKPEDYNIVELLYLAEDMSLKVMQTTEEDPAIRAWYHFAAVPEDDPEYIQAKVKAEQ